MHILRIISHLDFGGVQRQMLLQLRDLIEMGIRPEVCVIDYRGRLADEFEASGIPVHPIKFKTRLDPMGLIRLRRLITSHHFDLVHTHMYAPAVAANFILRRRGNIKLINGYHNQIVVKQDSQKRRIRKMRNIPDAFIAVSNAVKASLIELGVPDDSINVIHNGVNGPENVSPLPPLNPGDPLRLVWMGRFVKQKRVDFLVDVVAACRDKSIPVHLTLLGDGGAFAKVRRRIDENNLGGMISTPGATTDVFAHLAEAHLYVSASYREGFPNALLEACSAGRPFVVSDIDPHRELMGDTSAGILAPVEIDDWTRALQDLAANPERLPSMAEQSLALGQKYSIRAAAERSAALYRMLCDK